MVMGFVWMILYDFVGKFVVDSQKEKEEGEEKYTQEQVNA